MKFCKYLLITLFVGIFFASCSGLLDDNRMSLYYQQQAGSNKPAMYTVNYNVEGGSKEAPTQKDLEEGDTFNVADYTGVKVGYTFIGWNDGQNIYKGGHSYTMPASNVNFIAEWEQDALPEGATLYTMFDVLKPDGEVDEVIFAKFPSKVQDKVRESLSVVKIKPVTADFQNKLINISIVDNYVPSITYVNGTWDGSGNTYSKAGDGFKVTKPTNVDAWDIVYYMYKGINPEYGANSSENTSTYGDGTETRVNRFMFYQFTGTSGMLGMNASLNNMLVAVDTYTNLIFAFAYPSDYTEIVGNKNPSEWTGISGAFYERDPIGYVDTDGSFIIENWYNKLLQNSKGFLDPNDIVNTGKSPYSHTPIVDSGEMGSAYLANIKSKTYVDDIGATYTVSDDGLSITKKINGAVEKNYTFTSASSEIVGMFKVEEGETATTVTFEVLEGGNVKLTEGETVTILTIDQTESYFASIKGKVFKYRGENGTANIIETYTVGSDGRSITKTEEGLNSESGVDYSFNSATSANTGIFTVGVTNVTFTLSNAGNSLTLTQGEQVKELIIESDFNHDFMRYNLDVIAKSIKNLDMKSRRKPKLTKPWETVNEAYITYAIRAKIGSNDTIVIDHKSDGVVKPATFSTIGNTTDTIGINETLPLSGSTGYEIPEYELAVTDFILDAIITTQGRVTSFVGDFVETDSDEGRATYNNYDSPKVVFKYDESKHAFVIDKVKSNNAEGKASYLVDFEIALGEEKDFTINYDGKNEITYTLSFREK